MNMTITLGPGIVTLGGSEYVCHGITVVCHGMTATIAGRDITEHCEIDAQEARIIIPPAFAGSGPRIEFDATFPGRALKPKTRRSADWKRAAYGPNRGRQ